jgi:nucleoside-diphosphate-sugar epimerase
MADKHTLLCFGFGYVARALAAALDPARWDIVGTMHDTRPDSPVGVQIVPFDDAGNAVAAATHILVSIPPGDDGDPTLLAHAEAIADATELEWVGYLSTTGVYGDTGGRAVDEAAPLLPSHERGRRRVKAEFAWQDMDVPLHVFRLAGIYGPGRSTLDQVRAGTAKRVAKPGHVFSRIHVDDIVQALVLSMAKPDPGAIYNMADDEAAAPADVVGYACTLLGVTPPPLVDFDEAVTTMSPMARSFWDDQRLIDNGRIKRDLSWTPRYPSYRQGLAAIASMSAPTSPVRRDKS